MLEAQRPQEVELIAMEAKLGEKWGGAKLEKDRFGLLRVKDDAENEAAADDGESTG